MNERRLHHTKDKIRDMITMINFSYTCHRPDLSKSLTFQVSDKVYHGLRVGVVDNIVSNTYVCINYYVMGKIRKINSQEQ